MGLRSGRRTKIQNVLVQSVNACNGKCVSTNFTDRSLHWLRGSKTRQSPPTLAACGVVMTSSFLNVPATRACRKTSSNTSDSLSSLAGEASAAKDLASVWT